MYSSSLKDGGLLTAIGSLSKPMSDNEFPSSSKASLSSLRERGRERERGRGRGRERGRERERDEGGIHRKMFDPFTSGTRAVKECQNVCMCS